MAAVDQEGELFRQALQEEAVTLGIDPISTRLCAMTSKYALTAQNLNGGFALYLSNGSFNNVVQQQGPYSYIKSQFESGY